MADEGKNKPRRSTRVQRVETTESVVPGSKRDDISKSSHVKNEREPNQKSTPTTEMDGVTGKREPRESLNARNDRPRSNEKMSSRNNPAGKGHPTVGEKRDGAQPTGKKEVGDSSRPFDNGTLTPDAKMNDSAKKKGGTDKTSQANHAQKMDRQDQPKSKTTDENNAPSDKKEPEKPGTNGSDTPDGKDGNAKTGDAAAGAKNKLKSEARGANATGVDYSDKGIKDQLEHQTADVVMDMTPGLGQANSARKALKAANKKKKEMSGDDDSNDLLDKTEEIADKTVDAGIKGAKYTAGAASAGAMGYAAASMLLLMKTLMFLKSMVFGLAGKIAGFFAGIFQGLTSFITGALGVSAAIGQAIASGVIALVVGVSSLLGVFAVDTLTMKDPGADACLPSQKAVDTASQDYVEAGGEVALLQEENAGKLWSVYSAMGGSKEQTAAVLGNLHYESGGLDPTATETISSEPFVMGPKKLNALAKDYDVMAIAPDYGRDYPAIKRIGIGLAQWTNGRNSLLVNYAKDTGANWYDFDTQIGFMLAGDEPYRQEQLKDFLAATPGAIDTETERFMNSWIGLSSPNASADARKTHATGYLFTLERATADTAYAEGILSGLNVNRGDGNAAAGAFFHDDGCGDAKAMHYAGDKAEDGTGEVPSGLALVPWTRETLPESLQQYVVNPELAGLAWGGASGWATNIYPGQCVALASSYFMQLYPEWNQGGRPVGRPTGNGKYTAGNWASHYGALTTTVPATGAVFSNSTSSAYGHAGIVQHVFANADILVVEQNIRGASGDANNQQYSWSWRVIKADRYIQDKWTFFKPQDTEPLWEKPSA